MKYSHLLKNRKIAIFIFLMVISVATLFAIKNVFVIQDVSINGTNSDVVISKFLTQTYEGKTSIFISKNDIKRYVESTSPQYVVLSIKKKLLKKNIVVEVEKRAPKYLVSAANGDFLIDEAWYIYQSLSSYDFEGSKIKYDSNLTPGEKLDNEIILSALHYLTGNNKVSVENEIINFNVAGAKKVYVPAVATEEEARSIQDLLQKVIQKYTIEGKDVEIIDLRYSDPIIKY